MPERQKSSQPPLEVQRRRGRAWRIAVGLLAFVVALLLYSRGGTGHWPEQLQSWGAGYTTALVIIVIMSASLTCGITASYLLILTPLLFPPHWSALITTTGGVLGAAGGYGIARFVGGSWAERFRQGRVQGFLALHSSFLALFGLRLAPFSPQSFINYAAGLSRVPLARFLVSALAALALKSYVYAAAVQTTIGVGTASNAVSAPALLSLLAVAALSITGHVLTRRFSSLHVATTSVSNRAG